MTEKLSNHFVIASLPEEGVAISILFSILYQHIFPLWIPAFAGMTEKGVNDRKRYTLTLPSPLKGEGTWLII